MADEMTLADSNGEAVPETGSSEPDSTMTEDFYAGGHPDRDENGNVIEKPDEKPDEKADVKPDEVVEPKPDEKRSFWDKGRQVNDQALANATKQNEANHQTITDLTDLVKTMTASQKPPDTAREDANKEIDALVASLNKRDADGDLVANAADVAKVMLRVREIDAKTNASASSQSSPQLEEFTKTLKALSDRMDASDADAEQAESSATLNAMLDGFDKQYSVTDKKGNVTSGMYRNDIIATVRTHLAELNLDGQDGNALPQADHVRLLLDAAYQKAFAEDPQNKGKKPKAKVEVTVDPGKGGATIPTAPMNGDNDQVFEQMRKSGEFG